MGFFTTAGNFLGIFTIFCMVVTLVAWLTKQPWRFRAFGTTAFLVVLTSGVWTLAILPSIVRPRVRGAEPFTPVFDRGGSLSVIVVSAKITAAQLDATLRKATIDLGSTGRSVSSGQRFTILARTVVHPRPGVSRIIELGTLERAADPKDPPLIRIDEKGLAEAQRLAGPATSVRR